MKLINVAETLKMEAGRSPERWYSTTALHCLRTLKASTRIS